MPEAYHNLSNIFKIICHGIFSHRFLQLIAASFLLNGYLAFSQTTSNPNQRIFILRENAPSPEEVLIEARYQESEGPIRHLRENAKLETSEAVLTADEIDYNRETGYAEARGNVTYKNFESGEELLCDRAEYDTLKETGKFYEVSGSVPAVVQARPGILSSNNPFVFKGRWAEKVEDRYFLYDGMITSCKLPKPWWTLRGPKFDVIPSQRAIAQRAVFRMKGVPLFYSPYYYKSLEKAPRRSGFLMPNIGNSSRRGFMFGIGYYWAINRSYDVTYRPQYFSTVGFAHMLDFRGKPTQKSDFDFMLYGVNDKSERQQGGYSLRFMGKAEIPKGWVASANINYLSSFKFRTGFAESYNEAIFTEVKSTALLRKHWTGYSINVAFDQMTNFQSDVVGDKVSIRKLPEVQFVTQDRQITKTIPLWFSFDTSASLMHRSQLLFETRNMMERLDAAPRLMTAWKWKHLQLVPSIQIRETYWGSSFQNPFLASGISANQTVGTGLWRHSFEVDTQLILPSMSKIYQGKGWLGDKFKHVIEPRAEFHYVSGIGDISRIIRFDDAEILTNTNDVQVTLTNRFYSKKNNRTREWATWDIWQRRYFDPTFGGAVIEGQRNIFAATAAVSGYAFLNQARNYSPVASNIRMEPVSGLGVSWRTDYDPLHKGVTNNSVTVDGRLTDFFLSAGHSQVKTDTILSPPANQFRATMGWGRGTRKGWNTAFSTVYDYREGVMRYTQTQVTYNSDCCGFSVQYRRFNWGGRFENQYRFSLAISNVANFGTLRKQDALF